MDSQLTYAAGGGHYVSPSLGPGASLRAMNPKMLKNETRSAQVRRGLLLKVGGGGWGASACGGDGSSASKVRCS